MRSGNIKLLLIEDSPSDAQLLGSLLKQVDALNFDITHASDLASGLVRVGENSLDVVILDLGLPDCVGIETYERLRAKAPDLPIIIVTGNDDREMLAETLIRGADNYLIKDAFDGNRVAVAVLAAMRTRASAQKPEAN